ncbi:MAG: hypothetical protein WD431_03875, partial [Cyclobacteriaceae bacterium]
VFTEFHRIFAGIDYSMRCVQEGDYGYIVNFWSDGEHKIRGDAASGRTYAAMKEAAPQDESVAERLQMYEYRVPEELYDFSKDPDGLRNLMDDPAYQEIAGNLKAQLFREMKRTNDHLAGEFEEGFL